MKNKTWLRSILVLMLLSSCKNKEDKILGTYKTFYNKNVEHTLEIKINHEFIQIFKSKDTIIKNRGSWDFDEDGDLEVKNWMDLNIDKNFEDSRPLGYCYPDPCGSSLLFVDGNNLKKNESDIDNQAFQKIK